LITLLPNNRLKNMWKEANDISKHLLEGTWVNHEHINLGKNRSGPRFEIGSSAVWRCVPQPTAMFTYFVVTLALHSLPSEEKQEQVPCITTIPKNSWICYGHLIDLLNYFTVKQTSD